MRDSFGSFRWLFGPTRAQDYQERESPYGRGRRLRGLLFLGCGLVLTACGEPGGGDTGRLADDGPQPMWFAPRLPLQQAYTQTWDSHWNPVPPPWMRPSEALRQSGKIAEVKALIRKVPPTDTVARAYLRATTDSLVAGYVGIDTITDRRIRWLERHLGLMPGDAALPPGAGASRPRGAIGTPPQS